jgi:UrcA family protein
MRKVDTAFHPFPIPGRCVEIQPIAESSAFHQLFIGSSSSRSAGFLAIRGHPATTPASHGKEPPMTKFIATLAAFTLFAAPALAGERDVVVRHADLDLKSDAGRNQLNRRIAAATEQVCGSYANASADEAVRIDRCRDGVRRDVASQLGARRGSAQLARR